MLFRSQAGVFPADACENSVGKEQGPLKNASSLLSVEYVDYMDPEKFIYKSSLESPKREITWDLASWREQYQCRLAQYKQSLQAQPALTPSSIIAAQQPSNQAAMQLGNVVHNALAQRMGLNEISVVKAVETAGAPAGTALHRQAVEILNQFYASPAWRQLEQMKVLGVELPFSFSGPQGIVNGMMDLLLQGTDGTIWVVDYKTDQLLPGEENAAALKYTPQLKAYVYAAEKLYPHTSVKAAVIFTRTAAWVPLEINGNTL